MRVSANFYLQEFVSPDVMKTYGNKAIQFLDYRIISLAEFYRSYFGKPLTINNWNMGGKFKERGFRSPNSTTGAALSQHKFGRAFDCDIEETTPQEAYEAILKNKQKFYDAGLRCLEDIKATPTWLHSDIRETIGHGIKPGDILIVKP